MENKCLYCYKTIDLEDTITPAGQAHFHPRCTKKFFGTPTPPQLNFTQEQILEMAEEVIKSQRVITGVQPKLSLAVNETPEQTERFTLVGLHGDYILKPQTKVYKHLPENEDLCMHLAAISKIKTVDHSLILLNSGEIAYITKRVDRNKGEKKHMEDMCQLTERLTEHKYKGSYEQIAKVIKQHSENPGLDSINFYEVVLFSFLTGNNDMHLKNFSLIKTGKNYSLCPAYDLVAAELVVEGDDEDLALHLNGKKKKIKQTDFETAMLNAGLNQKVIDNIFKKFKKLLPKWTTFIDESFLPKETKENYKTLILQKAKQINLV